MSERKRIKLAKKLNAYPSQKLFKNADLGSEGKDLIYVRSDDDEYNPLL